MNEIEKLRSEYVEWLLRSLERGEGLDGETVVIEILERFKKARGM